MNTSLTTTFHARLIPLPDGRSGLRNILPVETREPAHAGRAPSPASIRDDGFNSCLDFTSSDATLDRYSEIISPTGWQLDSYLRNPVFQNAHQYGDIIFTLGRALITEVRTGPPSTYLFQRIQFAVDANPMARIAYALYKGKFLNAVSVGFIPIRWEDGSEQSGYARKYFEQELLEVSAVAIPANPNALMLAFKSGAVQKSDLNDTAELLRQLSAVPASPTSRADQTGRTDRKPALLNLARELRNILRA